MNSDRAFARSLLQDLRSRYLKDPPKEESTWVVFPPAVHLPLCLELLTGSGICWGAQDLSPDKEGPCTGEISAEMLRDLGCQYVLIGHSERRQRHGEKGELLQKKWERAHEVGLIPVFCVGETRQEREEGRWKSVLQEQLSGLIKRPALLTETIIAYEPVWAIGTGLAASPEQVAEVHQTIYENVKNPLPILYGGSVKMDNARALMATPHVDGALVGGASLKADEFIGIGRWLTSY